MNHNFLGKKRGDSNVCGLCGHPVPFVNQKITDITFQCTQVPQQASQLICLHSGLCFFFL
jgi:hypothetical protein